jgi:hypothetical protein
MIPILPYAWQPNIGNPYLPSSPVGFGLLHYHQYLTEKYNLLSAFDLPSQWEVPIMNQWFMNTADTMLHSDNVPGALNLLRLCAGLEYLVVYKNLLPPNILRHLDSAQSLQKTFDKPSIAVYRINDTAPYISATRNAALLFSGSYADSLPALSNIGLGRLPILLGETPQGVFNLGGLATQENLIPVLMNIDVPSIIDSYIASNNTGLIDLGRAVSGSSESHWEPPIGGSILTLDTPGMTFQQSFSESHSGNYVLLIRSVTNGPSLGNVSVTVDDRAVYPGVAANTHRSAEYGAKWFDLGTFYLKSGSHTIAITPTGSDWIYIDAILVIPASQFLLKYDSYSRELLGFLARSQFTEIYLASDASTSLIAAERLSVMQGQLAQTLSGNHTGAGVLALEPGGSASLLVEVPISSDYHVQARVSGSIVLGAQGQTLMGALTADTGGWKLESSAVEMKAGNEAVTLKNASNSTVYVDFVSVGTAQLTSLRPQPIVVNVSESNPEYVTVRLVSEPAYILVGVSYYPQWHAIPEGSKYETCYLANGFLTVFYVKDTVEQLLFV